MDALVVTHTVGIHAQSVEKAKGEVTHMATHTVYVYIARSMECLFGKRNLSGGNRTLPNFVS